jgi:DNA invertase Pin-like site-specific DNA recombinase
MQTEQSIEGQIKVCTEFSEKNGYTIIGRYIDRAISGTTDNRPEFLRMIEDSHKRQFDGVLVYQLDRFARNRYDSAIYKAKLKKNGVRVFSAKENITDDASGILVEGLLESMAEYYSAELSQKIRRGLDLNAQKLLATGGNVALGYIVDENRQFVIDEHGAEIVRMVFTMYANGKTITEIIRHLNSLNYRSSKGAPFNKNSLTKMLRNKRYIGIYTYKDTETKDGIPRIVSDEVFNQVAERLAINKKAPARAKAKVAYVLTTKLFCGYCRNMMTGESGTSKTGKLYHYYKCNHARKKLCHKKPVHKDFIENFVVNECRALLTDDNIEEITVEVMRINEQEQDQSTIKRLKKSLSENERKRANMLAAIAECDIDSVRKLLYEHMATLENERLRLEQQLSIEQLSAVSMTKDEITFFLSHLRNGNINDEKYRQILVNVFLNSVYLYDDKLTLIFNTSHYPASVEVDLLNEIEAQNKDFESSFLELNAPPLKRLSHAVQRRVRAFVAPHCQCVLVRLASLIVWDAVFF